MKKDKTIISDQEVALHYLKTFSNTAREPFLVLNSDLVVVVANNSFYKDFRVVEKDTENKLVYELGDGQWNIPELKKLLEEVLPEKKVFNDFEVAYKFPKIGFRTMLLNARQLDGTKQILLAIEDITLKKAIQVKLANYTKDLEKGIAIKTEELKVRIDELSQLNDVMVGRELKMIELKAEIAELKKND